MAKFQIASPEEIRTLYQPTSRISDMDFNPDEGLTQQSFKDECDINNIVKRDQQSQPIRVNEREPIFADFGDAMDYQTHQNYIAEANSAFFSLPAETRSRFKNDPAELLDFVQNEANYTEALKLGLVSQRPEPVIESLSNDLPDMIPNPAKKRPQTAPKPAED